MRCNCPISARPLRGEQLDHFLQGCHYYLVIKDPIFNLPPFYERQAVYNSYISARSLRIYVIGAEFCPFAGDQLQLYSRAALLLVLLTLFPAGKNPNLVKTNHDSSMKA